MNRKRVLTLVLGVAFGAALTSAGTISYSCGPSVAAATCNYLNTTVAGMYGSTFTDASASIYITYGATGLAQSETALNVVSYSQYVGALAANPSTDALQVSALAALNTYDAGPYGRGNVSITSPLASALDLTSITNTGVEVGGGTCTLGTAGCYDGIVTVTNNPSTPLYYDNLGGPEPADAYDFYATVEGETDEVLGTASCIDTTEVLSDGCDPFGPATPSAVDLFRYSSPGSLILDSSRSTVPGAYFSYNGGVTNGVIGVGGSPKYYNTLANGEDYADFVSSSPCQANQVVQDAEGCPGQDAGLNILDDGGGEIDILNAVGFDLTTATATPEPGAMTLFGLGCAALAAYRRRRRA